MRHLGAHDKFFDWRCSIQAWDESVDQKQDPDRRDTEAWERAVSTSLHQEKTGPSTSTGHGLAVVDLLSAVSLAWTKEI